MIFRNIVQKVILLIAVGLLAGCSLGADPPKAGEIQAQPSTTIQTGETATLDITAEGTDLKFEWTVDRGTLSDSTGSSVIYTAPNSPGRDVISVKVSTQGGEITKNISFDVVAPPPPTATDTPVPADTPTPTAVPKPIACIHPSVTKNLFPQLADESVVYPIYADKEARFLCQAVYDRVHDDGSMAIHIEYENFQSNFGWWGIATPNGYNAASYSEICLWAYAQEPGQSFRFKMKDTAKHEEGPIITLAKTNEWEEVCVKVTEFVELGINVASLDNVNLGFETATGSAEIWLADFEFK